MSTHGAGKKAKTGKVHAETPRLDVVGWRERLDLPDLGLRGVKAKIDTGARSSCLHADDIEFFTRRGREYVRFVYHARKGGRGRTLEAELLDMRWVKSSNGKREHRPTIVTRVELGGHSWLCEVTLSARWDMGFPMLLGREALRRRFFIHPGASYLLSHDGAQDKK